MVPILVVLQSCYLYVSSIFIGNIKLILSKVMSSDISEVCAS